MTSRVKKFFVLARCEEPLQGQPSWGSEQAKTETVSDILYKSVVFMAGAARSHTPISAIYLHKWGYNYNGDKLMTAAQSAKRYIMYTHRLGIRYL